MRYVFNAEDDDALLGEYVETIEDAVIYRPTGSSETRVAPEDCVRVREVAR